MNLDKVEKLLIIRLSSLGDVLLTTPLLRIIKSCNPDIIIDFVVKAEYSDAIKCNPNLSKIYNFRNKENSKELAGKLKQNGYNLVIDLQNNFRSKKFVNIISKPVLKFKKPSLNKFLLVNFKINRFKEIVSIPQRYSEVFNGIELDAKGLEFFYPDNIKSGINGTEKMIGFCPGSKHYTKMWPEEYFIELGNLLKAHGFSIVLFGGRDDKEVCDKISNDIDGSTNLCKENDLFQIAADMERCQLIICNDSGLMHLATAVDVPVVAFFGSTVKEFGFSPYKARNLILENNSLSCRPCSHVGKNKCPQKHFKCMKELIPKMVLENTINFLKEL